MSFITAMSEGHCRAFWLMFSNEVFLYNFPNSGQNLAHGERVQRKVNAQARVEPGLNVNFPGGKQSSHKAQCCKRGALNHVQCIHM